MISEQSLCYGLYIIGKRLMVGPDSLSYILGNINAA